ncbi:uncharacterized protein LOC115166768 isoform X1 [Salmo trutta]|uniref:Uncharacterized LOC115166768 n=1 Tax=Salmo trutta TaxID=8032 RepID=A0A673X9C3_SALTR|nr:uncharacterized protein LOC115166768 isoform X1 [Salmo trutta]
MDLGMLLLLVLSSAVCHSTDSTYYGGTMRSTVPGYMPPDSKWTGEVQFHYRENGRDRCEQQFSWECTSGYCNGSANRQGPVVQTTDKDQSGQNLWCQSEGHFTRNFTRDQKTQSYTLSDSGCCWGSNVNGKTNWTIHTEVDLGLRISPGPPTQNTPPVTATVPTLRVPQNCFSTLPLLAYDPDGDDVRCHFSVNVTHPNVTLDMVQCTLHATGLLAVGLHVFEILLQDHPTVDVNMTGYKSNYSRKALNESYVNNPTPTPFSRVPLQFAVEIQPALSSCLPGYIRPQFLTPTPSHGDVHHAAVGHLYQLEARVKAAHAKIFDFQVSGPSNMTKKIQDESVGVTRLFLGWTPQERHLKQNIPICFTAETNESQSEMRCVVVVVVKALALTGEANVSCTANRISIAVIKAYLPEVDMKWLRLADSSCSLTSNQTHIMGTMSLNSCGTKMEDAGDFMVFKNEINSFDAVNATITRRNQINIGFSCRYPKTVSISNYYQIHSSNYMFTESNFGSFGYTFEVFKDSKFSQKVDPSAYPVNVKLMDRMYMGIQAQSDLPKVQLLVESCKATPDDSASSSLFYDLIKDGCLKDETVKVYPGNLTQFYFEVQAFKFTGSYDQVYLTCTVILCEVGNPNSRCGQGCLNTASRRRRRDLPIGETDRHYITQGPFRVVREAQPSADQKTGADEKTRGDVEATHFLRSDMGTIVFAGLFIMTLMLLAVVVVYFLKKSRAEEHKALIAYD